MDSQKDVTENLGSSVGSSYNVERALHEAISVIYLDDNSDYRSALWAIIKLLGGEDAVELLSRDPAEAFYKYEPKKSQEHCHEWWYISFDGATEVCRCGATRKQAG